MSAATEHYLTEQVDPLFIRSARDYLFPELRPGRVLNVGVGYGVWDERLASSGNEVVCVDLDGALLEHFRPRFPSIRYVHSDVLAYEPDGPFDTIVASHLLEHMDDPVGLLRRFAAWLRPGGRMLLVVPNADSVHRHIGRRMGLLSRVTELNDGDLRLGHRRVYTQELLRQHLDEAGLRVRSLTGVTFKPLSNAQLAALPKAYVQACVAMAGDELGALACQLAAVVEP